MLVLDASAVTEFLLGSSQGRDVAGILACHSTEDVHVPHLCLTETTNALRGLVLGRQLSSARAGVALRRLLQLGGVRHAPDPYLPRVLELRHHLTAYDAMYVALAETLDADLVTCDARVSRASGHHARVVAIGV